MTAVAVGSDYGPTAVAGAQPDRPPTAPDPGGGTPPSSTTDSSPDQSTVDTAPPPSGVDGGGADRRGNRRLVTVGLVLVLAAVAVVAGMARQRGPADQPAPVQVAAPSRVPATAAPRPAARPAAPARPLTVRIPAIGVSSTLVPLRLDKAGALQPPGDFVHAGWYTGGPAPGELGPAVIAGHVDSRKGPAIFFRLRELKPGDQVLVTRSDRRTARFRVVEVQRYPKNMFPAARVYMPTPDAALRLITCGGSFDYARRSYRDNIVVYAVSV